MASPFLGFGPGLADFFTAVLFGFFFLVDFEEPDSTGAVLFLDLPPLGIFDLAFAFGLAFAFEDPGLAPFNFRSFLTFFNKFRLDRFLFFFFRFSLVSFRKPLCVSGVTIGTANAAGFALGSSAMVRGAPAMTGSGCSD